MNRSFQVSVLVLTYNSDWDLLKSTLLSIINQKEVEIEVIVSDDGSVDNCFEQCKELFVKYHFDSYSLVPSTENQGTVLNLQKGLKCCHGEYIKPISPGDFIYSETTLSHWYSEMKKVGADVSFGNYISYASDNNETKCWVGERPFDKKVYRNKNKRGIKYRYLLMDDLYVGATTLVRREVLENYNNIIANKVKYTDDCIYRIIISDDIMTFFHDTYVIWYNKGTGISTSGNSKWKGIIDDEFIGVSKIIAERLRKKRISWFNLRYMLYLYLRKYKHGSKYLLFPSLLRQRNKKYESKEQGNFDSSLLDRLLREGA